MQHPIPVLDLSSETSGPSRNYYRSSSIESKLEPRSSSAWGRVAVLARTQVPHPDHHLIASDFTVGRRDRSRTDHELAQVSFARLVDSVTRNAYAVGCALTPVMTPVGSANQRAIGDSKEHIRRYLERRESF